MQKNVGKKNQQAKVSEVSLMSMKKGLLGLLPFRKRKANVREKGEDEFLCFSLH